MDKDRTDTSTELNEQGFQRFGTTLAHFLFGVIDMRI